MRIHDISLPIGAKLAGWPGDDPYRFTWTSLKGDGSTVNLGSISMSVHTGSHADAPYHVDDALSTIDRLSLEPFVGPCVVVDVQGIDLIEPSHIPAEAVASPRVLLKTRSWTDHSGFPEEIPSLSDDMPAHLAGMGVALLGLDVPSVDPIHSKTLSTHHALNAANIRILESLDLSNVSPGTYELIALPLKLEGADGSPVRAILIER